MLCPIEDVVFMYCSSTCFTLRGGSTFPFQPASSLHSLGACQDLNRLFWASVACEGTGLHSAELKTFTFCKFEERTISITFSMKNLSRS